ncbi:MAG: crosslink repair DNA glycosylase YcaQ family protein [Kofleriaceae bacterium]
MRSAPSLSLLDARRLALRAQGLDAPRPAAVTSDALAAMVGALGALQLDSVNVLTRSHYLPAWSRLGAYAPEQLDALASAAPRRLFEYWGHEASLLPIDLYPLLRWRMDTAAQSAWRNIREVRKKRALVAGVLAMVRERGPIPISELPKTRTSQRSGAWWGWSESKLALEWLFWSGQITSAGRRRFERLYDVPERVLPASILAQPARAPADAQRALVERAAQALGVATEADLRDYYRLPLAAARGAIAELVKRGGLTPVHVEGWSHQAYAPATALATLGARPARAAEHGALLSPFDSLIWNRARTERLFGMRVRLEVYVPEAKRVHGYYVLPFLLGEELVARVDLKADRPAKTLRVLAAHVEPAAQARAAEVADALARELTALAAWQGLATVKVARRGALAAALAAALGPARRAPSRPSAGTAARRPAKR